MTGYIGQAPGQGQIQYFTFTATAGQTTFTGVDANSYVLNYSPGFCDVFLNGRRLTPISDYTAIDGSTIVLQSAASLNDVIFVASASTFDTADWVTNAINYVYTASAGQTTFTGADDNANTLSYVNGTILVSLNGINLPQSDFTATNGSTVVLNSGVNAGDIVQIFSLRTMAVVSFLPLSGGTITGSLTVGNSSVNTYITAGNIALNGSTLLIGNSSANVVINGSSLVISNSTTTATVGLGPATINSLASNTFTIGTGTYFVANGNVGVNSASPAKKLHIYASGSVGETPQLLLEGGTNGYGAGITMQSRTSSGGALVEMARIVADGDNSWNTTASTQDARLSFWTTLDGTAYERMRITSDGNVGIGVTPTQKLHAIRSGSGIVARFSDNATQTLDIGIYASGGVYYDNPNGGYHNFSQSGVSRMMIDSSGRVTQPYQPMFSGTVADGNGWRNLGNTWTIIKMNSIPVNVGSCYNSTTGNFTCPVAGTYKVSIWFLGGNGGGASNFSIFKNGSQYVGNIAHINTNGYSLWMTAGLTFFVSCATNDTIAPYGYSGSSTFYTDGNYTGMTIELVG